MAHVMWLRDRPAPVLKHHIDPFPPLSRARASSGVNPKRFAAARTADPSPNMLPVSKRRFVLKRTTAANMLNVESESARNPRVQMHNHLLSYAERLRNLRRAHANAPETALAPAFQDLLAAALTETPMGAGLTVVPEFAHPGIGRPDIALVRAGAPARAFVELKAPDIPADPRLWRTAHGQRQAERLKELRCWGTSNFTDFRLLERKDEVAAASIVPEQAIDPACDDARAARLIAEHDVGPLLALIERLAVGAGLEPTAENAEHLAGLLAHASRFVRGIVRDRLADLRSANTTSDPLLEVHAEFRTVLYARPEAGGYADNDFDTLFSSAFAQTLAFGLLLVREGSGRPVDRTAYQSMPEQHPLMRTALRVLTQEEILDVVGAGFTVMLDTVNSFAPEILAPEPDGRDPILYFYEDFLSVFDPKARERHGVYFTPVEVVRFMVGALDRVARDNLKLGDGLRNPDLTILDPATGTGTFPLGVAERVRDEAAKFGGPGRADLEIRNLAGRIFGLELLIGPYAVAHYRMHHILKEPPGGGSGPAVPRVGVYLTDTLAEPGAEAPLGRLGFLTTGITDERRQADDVKARRKILAIIGNPPYRRLAGGEVQTLIGRWMNDLWDDLKQPVRDAGHGNMLNTFPELSVAFWRWAMWKIFEADDAPGRGVVAFITNRNFLTGLPYSGLRRAMRDRFDRIEIIDLRGNKRMPAPAGTA